MLNNPSESTRSILIFVNFEMKFWCIRKSRKAEALFEEENASQSSISSVAMLKVTIQSGLLTDGHLEMRSGSHWPDWRRKAVPAVAADNGVCSHGIYFDFALLGSF